MERMYRALTWLAGVALVCGLLDIVWFSQLLTQTYTVGGGSAGFGGGPQRSYIVVSLIAVAHQAVGLLGVGVGITASAVAWAERRWRWLAALTLAVLLYVSWTFAQEFALILLATHPAIQGLLATNQWYLSSLWELLPVGLALGFARVRGAGRRQLRAQADAALEITRSSL